MRFVWFLFSLSLLAGCSRQSVTVNPDSSLPVLDITADYPEREIDLVEEAEIEYSFATSRNGTVGNIRSVAWNNIRKYDIRI